MDLSSLPHASELARLASDFESTRRKLAEDMPEFSMILSFQDLEYRLMKQFFLHAVEDISAILSFDSLSDEAEGPQQQANEQPSRTQKERASDPIRQETSATTATTTATTAVITKTRRRFPVLPPEVVEEILSHVAADELPHDLDYTFRSRKPTTLISCTLVNRVLSTFGRQSLYRRLKLSNAGSLYTFAFSSMLSARPDVPKIVSTVLGLQARSYVQKLELSCSDQSVVWDATLHTMFRFPNLRCLWLRGIGGIDKLHPLFNQTLPFLQKLLIHGDACLGLWEWTSGPSYNRDQAKAFFSRLLAIDLYDCTMDPNELERPEFVDMAHENLRSIAFPDYTPHPIATEFFGKCSDALVSADTRTSHFSQKTFETSTTTCTGLKAFAVTDTDHVDVDAFVSFIEKRGRDLVCLVLWPGTDVENLRPIMRAIMTHCRSLEALSLDGYGDEFAEDCIELISRLGARLNHLNLDLSIFEAQANTRLDRVADCCPNLERFEIPHNVELYVPDPPQEEQEGQKSQEPQNSASTTNNVMENAVLEEIFAKLLRQCPKVRYLGFSHDFDGR
ncbi:hypothetical protein HK102_007758 [Quaeritorhiza haematococci]|nr:hypothetical protein HK102_007758 [Quaeritorhiza haematococci]